ncbi:MAG: hypothetical protein AABW59_00500 [archaeon]
MSLEHKNRVFSKPRNAMLFVLEEMFLLSLILYLLYKIVAIQFLDGQVIFFSEIAPIQNVMWFWGMVIFFVVVYFAIARRDALVMKIHRDLFSVVLLESKLKIVGANRQVYGLYIAEMVFVAILAVSIYLYLDPEINIVPFPFNFIGFFAFILVSFYMFSQTRQFRQQMYGPSLITSIIFPKEKLHQTKRVTNLKTGSIRISSNSHYSALNHFRKKLKK